MNKQINRIDNDTAFATTVIFEVKNDEVWFRSEVNKYKDLSWVKPGKEVTLNNSTAGNISIECAEAVLEATALAIKEAKKLRKTAK